MAVRTNPESVKAILANNYDQSIGLEPFIDSASSIVDWLESVDVDSELSATKLELIERWIAAHCYALTDQVPQTESKGKASATYQGQTGMALNATRYGQMALTLDITGRLAKLGKEHNRAKITWLGVAHPSTYPNT